MSELPHLSELDLEEAAFSGQPDLGSHLAYEICLAFARSPHRVAVVDHTAERRTMRAGFLFAVSWQLSKRVQTWTEGPRVGIVFPPGLGGTIANLAVVLAGKVPVNLNYTLGDASIEACLRRAEIDCLLSTERVRRKLAAFPWPSEGVIDLVAEIKALPKLATLLLVGQTYLLPGPILARRLRLPRSGGDAEAGLLFTSGSSGEPKGVALTHRNILGNCAQIDRAGLLPRGEKLVANLPIFHSFGFTVTLWYPLLRECIIVAVPSPLETKKTAAAIEAEQATVLVGTPTFLKPYFKRIKPAQLSSLKFVIAGAAKTPPGFGEAWEEKFGGCYLEGYGLTETSPVVSVNLPAKPEGINYPGGSGEGRRAGSVGRLLPGLRARLLDVDTKEPLDIHEVGLLALKGANIFGGYLGQPEQTAEVLENGWFITGDLARFDADGFLFIEGRLSRFSKIGGEMVPHATIEAALVRAFGFQEVEHPVITVAGRADEAKGESLVLITSVDMEPKSVREHLLAAGFSNLWIPRTIERVEAIPTLATGKLDLRAINQIAQNAAED